MRNWTSGGRHPFRRWALGTVVAVAVMVCLLPGVSRATTDTSASGGVPTLEEQVQALDRKFTSLLAEKDAQIAALQAQVEQLQGLDGKFTSLLAQKDAQIAALQTQVAQLQGGLKAESAARESADRTLQEALTAESGARLAADNELQKSVSDLSVNVRQIGEGIVELWRDLDTVRNVSADTRIRLQQAELALEPLSMNFYNMYEEVSRLSGLTSDLHSRMSAAEWRLFTLEQVVGVGAGGGWGDGAQVP